MYVVFTGLKARKSTLRCLLVGKGLFVSAPMGLIYVDEHLPICTDVHCVHALGHQKRASEFLELES